MKNPNNQGHCKEPLGYRQMTNIWIIGVPEGEEEKQEIKNLFQKIMKENFPNLVKEIDMQVQETQSPKQVGPKEDHTKMHHN